MIITYRCWPMSTTDSTIDWNCSNSTDFYEAVMACQAQENELAKQLHADQMRRRDLGYLVPPRLRRLHFGAVLPVRFAPVACSYRQRHRVVLRKFYRVPRQRSVRRVFVRCGAIIVSRSSRA